MQVRLPCRRIRFKDHPESDYMELSVMIPKDMKHSINDLYRLALDEKDKGTELDIQIGHRTKNKSKSANGKMWSVLARMANRLDTGVTEQYERALHEYGVSETVNVPAESADEFISVFTEKQTGNLAETIVNDGQTAEIRIFYGTSSYNNEEMERLLRGICNDADELGIDTVRKVHGG